MTFSRRRRLVRHEPLRRRPSIDRLLVESLPLAQHRLFNLVGDDRPSRSQVVADPVDFGSCTGQELQVGLKGAGLCLLVSGANKVEHVGGWVRLSVTIDTPVSLFQAIGVPRDLYVKQPVTSSLQVDAFRGSVGGEQDPNRVEARIGLERCLDGLPLVVILAAKSVRSRSPCASPAAVS